MRFNNLPDVLRNRAQNFSNKPFIIYGRQKISFKELDCLSSYLASYLYEQGIAKDDKAAVWMYNCPEFIISYFAILKTGAVVVPINNMFKREEAKYVAEDSQAKILICSCDKVEDSLNLASRIDGIKKIISFSFDTEKYPSVANLSEILDKRQDFETWLEIAPQDSAEILYTSGTTGKPKGAELTHANLISNVEDCISAIETTSKDAFICLLPLFHSFASTVCMLFPLYSGCSCVVFRAIRPFKRILRSIRKNKITVFTGVPSLFNILKDIKIPWILKTPLMKLVNPLRVCISGAAALPKEIIPLFEKKFKTPLLEGYGLTEASPVVSLNPLRGKRIPGSVGKAFASVKVKIVDPQGKNLTNGEIGELLVKGPNVMKGYFRKEEDTAEVIKGGWLYTGDLARIDKEGYIYIVGRLKDMINVRGLNVYPREIEELLYQLSYIKEAAVVGINHPKKGEVPVAFVVLKEGVPKEAREILSFLRQNLASFKVPFRVEIKDGLPKNTTGKVLKYALREETEKKLFNLHA